MPSGPSRKKPAANESEMASSDDEVGDFQVRFQEAHGARLFRQGKPRALLEVKSPDITPAVYEARLRGYDRAAAKERASQVEKK
jgi:hypothetical protein